MEHGSYWDLLYILFENLIPSLIVKHCSVGGLLVLILSAAS